MLAAIWIGVVLVGAGPAVGAGRPDPTETMRKVARDLNLQTEMPKPDEDKSKGDLHYSDARWHIPGGAASFTLYAALAVALGFIVYALRDSIPGFSRRSRLKGRDKDVATILPNAESVARMNEAGDDADELARRGLFAEAMHVLLLRSLAELRRRLDVTIADSLTSREVLQRLTLPDLGRRALGDLIQRVELVYFGSRPAAHGDYSACRSSFDALIGAMQTGAMRAGAA